MQYQTPHTNLIFSTIFQANGDIDNLFDAMKMSKRLFYPRIARLKELGMIKKYRARYFVTEFGKVVFRFQLILDNACQDYWKLKALDYIPEDGIPNGERDQIIKNMIQNKRIRDIIRH